MSDPSHPLLPGPAADRGASKTSMTATSARQRGTSDGPSRSSSRLPTRARSRVGWTLAVVDGRARTHGSGISRAGSHRFRRLHLEPSRWQRARRSSAASRPASSSGMRWHWQISTTFDTVFDSGLFHVFDDHRAGPVPSTPSLTVALGVGGRVLLACFSDRQPGLWGPPPGSRSGTPGCLRRRLGGRIHPKRLNSRRILLRTARRHGWPVLAG